MYVYNSERENTYYKDACVAHSRQILATSFNIKYRLIFARNFPSNLYTHIHFTFFFSFNFLCLLFPPAWNFFLFSSVSLYLFIHFVQSLLLGAPLIRVAFLLLTVILNRWKKIGITSIKATKLDFKYQNWFLNNLSIPCFTLMTNCTNKKDQSLYKI